MPLLKTLIPACILLALLEAAAQVTSTTPAWVRALSAWPDVQVLIRGVLGFAIVNVPLMLAEWLWPGTRTRRAYVSGLKFWALYIAVTYAWSKAAVYMTSRIPGAPLFSLEIEPDSGVLVMSAGILGTVAVFDFFYYWFHRAQHRFGALWSFHRVHHSIVHLNCVNSYHHVLEEVFRFPFMAVPLALLVKIQVPQLMLLSAFVAGWAYYIHSDTRVSFGRVWPFLADNRYHRIHHSLERRHFDKNFAAFFPVWDWLFGTYHAPEPAHVPAVGLVDTPEPATVADYVLLPFRPRTPMDREADRDQARVIPGQTPLGV